MGGHTGVTGPVLPNLNMIKKGSSTPSEQPAPLAQLALRRHES